MTSALRFLITADDRASAAFAKVRGQITGLQGEVGVLGTALRGLAAPVLGAVSVAGLVQFVRGAVNGIDALNDLKDATGASIENLSALEDVALRTGSSMETAGAALGKLNQALNAANDPASDAAMAIAAIGLSLDELKRLDPVVALQRVGQALAGFADDGAKGRIQLELLGKGTRELAPLLKDLAEAGALVGKVTTEQAEAAERFNKELAALNKNALDLARTLAGPLVESLNAAFVKMRQAQQEGNLLSTLFGAPFSADTRRKQLALLFGGNEGGATGSWGGPEAPADTRPRLPDLPGRSGGAGRATAARPERVFSAARWLAGIERDLERQFIDLDSRARDREADAQQRRIDSFRDFAGQLRDENARLSVDLIEDDQARAKAQILLEEQVLLRKLELLGVYGEEYEQAQQLIAQNTALALRGVKTEAKQAQDSARDVGLVFASAAGQAITQWSSFRDLLKGIGADLLQIALKSAVTDPLSNLVGSAVGGSGLNLGSLFAGFFADGGRIGPGQWGIVGERGPELVRAGAAGATVVPGAGGVTLVQHIHIGAGVTRNEMMAGLSAARQSAIAGVADAMRRGAVAV